MRNALAVMVGVILIAGVTTALAVNANAVKSAAAATKLSEKGTSVTPDTTKRPAAKNKHIFIIDAGTASASSLVPDQGATAAAKALGWTVTSLDGKLSTGNYAGLVSQAIAQGANGIILDAVDCKYAQNALKLAKSKGIVTIPIYAFDCNDKVGGDGGSPLFSGCSNYGNRPCNKLQTFTESYGGAQANYVINATKGKGTVLVINDPEFTVLQYTAMGFEQKLKAAGQPYVVFNFKVADLLGGKLQGEVTTELLKLKAANTQVAWIKSPFAAATELGISQAVKTTAPKVPIMGGEGFAPELPLVQAANVISSTWTGWSAVDAMNSLFDKQATRPSGIGWTIVKGPTTKQPKFPNFIAAYKKAWGK